MRLVRTFLILGRVSNLPTVWSNCLAAWWLGGGGEWLNFFLLLAGATLMYTGGMFLNDAFDAPYDSVHRRSRPIPSGLIQRRAVFNAGLGLLAVGCLAFCLMGRIPGVIAAALFLCIVLYNAIHKVFVLSPAIMGACRFLLYAAAGAATAEGLTGWPLWCGLALAFYVAGLSFLARVETAVTLPSTQTWWPCLLMIAAPVFLAFFMNRGVYFSHAIWLSVILAIWVLNSLRYAFATANPNMGRTVSGLLAGIVLVDVLALAEPFSAYTILFVVLLLLAKFSQRFVPAT